MFRLILFRRLCQNWISTKGRIKEGLAQTVADTADGSGICQVLHDAEAYFSVDYLKTGVDQVSQAHLGAAI